MKKRTVHVTRFELNNCMYDGFYVEVSPTRKDSLYNFSLCRDWIGMKRSMFSLPVELAPEEKWEKIIEDNVDRYIEYFLDALDFDATLTLSPENVTTDSIRDVWWEANYPDVKTGKQRKLTWKEMVCNRVHDSTIPVVEE